MPIILGSEDVPLENAYGIAFRLKFDPGLVTPSNAFVEFVPSWLGAPGANLLTLDKSFASEGYIEIAMVRNDQNEVDGHGPIMHFIGIIDDVLGKDELKIELEDVRAITFGQMPIPLDKPVEIVEVLSGTSELNSLSDQVMLFPNPTHDWVNISWPQDIPVSETRILNLEGKELATMEGLPQQIRLNFLPQGVYLLAFQTEWGLVHKRLVKF